MKNERLEKELAKQHPTNRIQVNNYIKRHRGVDPELFNGGGYLYFGTLYDKSESAVYVNSVSQMSYAEWLAEYDRMKGTE